MYFAVCGAGVNAKGARPTTLSKFAATGAWQASNAKHKVMTLRGSMPDFKFACPHCDQHLQCDQRMSGRQIQCPHCNTLIRIPPVPGKTVQYAPESGKTWDTFVGGRAAP